MSPIWGDLFILIGHLAHYLSRMKYRQTTQNVTIYSLSQVQSSINNLYFVILKGYLQCENVNIYVYRRQLYAINDGRGAVEKK